MFSKKITIFEHDYFFNNASSNFKPHFQMFRFKQDNKEFVSNEEVSCKLGPNYFLPCSQLNFKADIQNVKERILERRKTL